MNIVFHPKLINLYKGIDLLLYPNILEQDKVHNNLHKAQLNIGIESRSKQF